MSVRWLLAPYRLGAWINSRLWTRNQPEPCPIMDGIWLGRLPTSAELAQQKFDALVDVTAEFDVPTSSIDRYSVPMLDLALPPLEVLVQAADAVSLARESGKRILVCCALGYSRSALTVAAWLLRSGHYVDVESAIELIRSARPQVVFSTADRELLAKFIDAR